MVLNYAKEGIENWFRYPYFCTIIYRLKLKV